MFLNFTILAEGQSEKKYIRKGNREYANKEYSESEVSYRKAAEQNKMSPNAAFNIGDALYRQKKYEDAGKAFNESVSMNEDKIKKATGLYNLGNSLLEAKKIEESIDAYKNSLRLDPENMKAKYNLAYAQDLLKKQQQQKSQQNQQNKDKNKEEKNKDDKQKKQQDQNNNNDQKNNQQNDQDKLNQKNQQPQQQQISKEDAERLLNALANDEKKVEQKVKLAKAAKEQVRTIKNW